MNVATKIVTASALLVLLLVGVLAYHVSLSRRASTATKESSARIPASATWAELETLVGDLEDTFRGLRALLAIADPDAGRYASRIAELQREFGVELSSLNRLTLTPEEKASVGEVRQRWDDYRVVWGELDPLALGALPESDPRQVRLQTSLQTLRVSLAEAAALTQNRNTSRLAESQGSKVEAERISWGVLGIALGLCTLVVVYTVRSISQPLGRLVEGTRAVAAGRFSYRLDLGRDAEFARLADAFNSMVRRLSELDQMKKDFVAHVSHELKNPLVAMQETNQLLADELAGPLNEKQRRLLALNIESGRRLSAMLSNLLDLSSLEAGAMTYEFKPTDLGELARLAVSEFEARARERKIALRLAPQAEPPVIAPADRDRLIQVLENLVENALKFSPAGSVVEVEVERLHLAPHWLPPAVRERLPAAIRDGASVLLAVADRGPGVAEAHKESIFRKFHQVGHNARTNGGGVGLGLAICRELVEAHDGVIWVMDRDLGGSRFCVLLPASEVSA